MNYLSAIRSKRFFRLRHFFAEDGILIPVIAFPFIFGICAGSFVGVFSQSLPALMDSFALLSQSTVPVSFADAVLRFFRYLLLALLVSTSLLGVFLLPALSFLRGFGFSCAVAALFAAKGYCGSLYALAALGIPALIEFPCFFVFSRDCFFFSRALFPAQTTKFFAGGTVHFSVRRIFLIVFLGIIYAAYCCFLLPQLLTKLF